MRLADFQFELPPELIAQRPPARRGDSRLLVLDGRDGSLRDGVFADIETLLRPGDLLVLNDTRVIPARLFGRKASGGRVELLLERLLDTRRALVQLRASRAPRPGSELAFAGGARARVIARRDALFELEFAIGDAEHAGADALLDYFRRHGRTPLPPYIERDSEDDSGRDDGDAGGADAADRERYQTVYARRDGAVAAPTAGLHFDAGRLERLRAAGVEQVFLTLHVGAGTFQPLRVERVEDHSLHAERVSVGPAVCDAVAAARARGGRVVAVGTTVVRSLESASAGDGRLRPFDGETALYIYPGYRFRCVDAMITNFHLPGSSLLLLVSAFAGRDAVLAAYRHAVAGRYRFFSYGDAMFIIGSRGYGGPTPDGQQRG